MIRQVSPGELPPLQPTDEASIRILSMAQVYGDRPFCRFYTDGDSVIAVADGTATVRFGADRQEAAMFLSMSPDIGSVRTDAAGAELLASRFRCDCATGTVMCGGRGDLPLAATEEVPLADLYALLSRTFADLPPFDVWYADAHYKLRHGGFPHAACVKDGRTVSCAMTVAQCDGAALLGGVATLPEYRRQGLASACVNTLVRRFSETKTAVWISPVDAAAESLYRSLGFAACGRWGQIKKGECL